MGKAPPTTVQPAILAAALAVPGVGGLHDLRAHYVGDRIHVELHVETRQETSLCQRPTTSAIDVRRTLEAVELVHEAFIHIDPV